MYLELRTRAHAISVIEFQNRGSTHLHLWPVCNAAYDPRLDMRIRYRPGRGENEYKLQGLTAGCKGSHSFCTEAYKH